MWQPVSNGGQLVVKIDTDQPADAELLIGLFVDAKWSKDPVAVRRVTGGGTHTLTGLPTGRFQIGAIAGRYAHAIGVQRQWPEPVEIRRGETATAEMLVSNSLRLATGDTYPGRIWDYLGQWLRQEDSTLLRGRITGPDGEPIPFASIEVRQQHSDGQSSFAILDKGTDTRGMYKVGRMTWPYTVNAIWYDPLPTAYGNRFQLKHLGGVFDGPQELNIQLDRFPQGTAKVAGRVVDDRGEPVQRFILQVSTRIGTMPLPDDASAYTQYGYILPFISEDGRFEVTELPDGPVTVHVAASDNLQGLRRYEAARSKDIVLEAGKTADVEFEFARTKLFYGRVLFDDKAKASVVTVARP